MTDRTIKPEEIVEGDDCTFAMRVTDLHFNAARGGWSGTRADGVTICLDPKVIAAATITRHEREPQVGDVGRLPGGVVDWRVEAVVAGDEGQAMLLLWNPIRLSNSCAPSDFTVTKRAGQ